MNVKLLAFSKGIKTDTPLRTPKIPGTLTETNSHSINTQTNTTDTNPPAARLQLLVPKQRSLSMLVGVGVDVVHTPRIQRLLAGPLKHKFLKRAFHPHEIDVFHNMHNHERALHFIASRWAVKEATLKALGARILYPEVKIARQPVGSKPILEVEGKSQELFTQKGVSRSHISISHDGEYVFANVVLEGQRV
jgi:holo-[acyl-carrier protein] synthase